MTGLHLHHISTQSQPAMCDTVGMGCHRSESTEHSTVCDLYMTHPPATMRREMSVTPAGTVKLEVPTCKGVSEERGHGCDSGSSGRLQWQDTQYPVSPSKQPEHS
jgi:hypothetical protein